MANEQNYNKTETERQIVEDVKYVQQHESEYGDVVDVVARRPIPADSDGRGDGVVYEYKLSDGRVVSNDEAWELANAHKLRNIIGSHNHGRKYIRSVGDGDDENNLGNLPTF